MSGKGWQSNVRRLPSGKAERHVRAEEQVETVSLPHYAKLPMSFELAAKIPEIDDSRWIAIGFDAVIHALASPPEHDEEQQGPLTLPMAEVKKRLKEKDELAYYRHRKKMEAAEGVTSRSLHDGREIVEVGGEMVGPEIPYRVVSAKFNRGIQASVFHALLNHPVLVKAIEEACSNPEVVINDLKLGRLAILVDRETRLMAIGPYDTVCYQAEASVAKVKPGKSLSNALVDVETILGEDQVDEVIIPALCALMAKEMAKTGKSGSMNATNVIRLNPKR